MIARRRASSGAIETFSIGGVDLIPSAAVCSEQNNSEIRLSEAVISPITEAVNGTNFAGCGQSRDDMMAATIRAIIESENAAEGVMRKRRMPTSRSCGMRDMASFDKGR